MSYTIAVAQTDPAVGNLEKNIRQHVAFVKGAIAKKAKVVIFPELSLTGYSVKDLNWDLALRAEKQPAFRELLELSKRITIIAGAVEESKEFGIYNSAFVFENGAVHSAHRKNYPPTYGMFEELRYFSAGTDLRAFPSKVGKLGILICEDMWHLPLPYLLAKDGAEVIISLTASPTRVTGSSEELSAARVNHEQHRSYARLLSTYVVFANRVGIEDGVSFWGGSQIVGPGGDPVAQAQLFEEDLITATIDPNEIRRARRFSRHFIDDAPQYTLHQLNNVLNRNNL